MSASKKLIQAGAGVGGAEPFYDYEIENSARFSGSETLYRAQTSPTNNKKWTFSCWFKYIGPTGWQGILGAGSSPYYTNFYMNSNHFLLNGYGPGSYGQMDNSAFYRDSSAWYHVVVAFDSTQASAGDRQKIWVNGVLEASPYSYGAWPLNHNTYINQSGRNLFVGRSGETASYSKQYLAECVFIDGQQLDPTNFAETKNGVWVPKEITGLTFGNNGFYLDFANSSALGTDVSGNGNNLTSAGFLSSDQMPDTPTNNFATLNPLYKGNTVTLSEGNLSAAPGLQSAWNTIGGLLYSKSWEGLSVYFEMRVTGAGGSIGTLIGLDDVTVGMTASSLANGIYWNNAEYWSFIDGTNTTLSGASTVGDIIGFLYDFNLNTMTLTKNGSAWLSATSFTAGDFLLVARLYYNSGGTTGAHFNFGQDSTFSGATTAGGNTDANGIGDFKYTVPAGALAICTANLPEPTIGPNSDTTSDEHFYVGLYTGTGATSAITQVPFSPDKVDIKDRDIGHSWMVFDRARGATNFLYYDTSGGQQTNAESLQSFDANGFTLGTHSPVNTSGDDYVFYCYKANGSGVTNTDGSITSTVSANTDAGFSIVTYTSNNTPNSSIGHGLGVTPKVIITRRVGVGSQWGFFGPLLGVDKYMYLDVGDGATTASGYMPAPSSTVVNTGANTWSALNDQIDTYVQYCFAEVEGFSSFGSYIGNGSTDGPFVYTGFRPAYLVIKCSSGASQWYVHDSARTPYNLNTNTLFLDLHNAESTSELVSTYGKDMLSNGFKIRASHGTHNSSGATYIYMAFAENPFKYSNAR